MGQLVLEISQFKVIFSPHKDAGIFMILSVVPIMAPSPMSNRVKGGRPIPFLKSVSRHQILNCLTIYHGI